MYFVNEEHRNNYNNLMKIYKLQHMSDVQYESNIYLAAVPDLYELIEKEQLIPGKGPLISLAEYSEDKHMLEASHPGLTGSTRWLVQAGLSLFNGNCCDLDYTNSINFAQVFIESFKIRNKID